MKTESISLVSTAKSNAMTTSSSAKTVSSTKTSDTSFDRVMSDQNYRVKLKSDTGTVDSNTNTAVNRNDVSGTPAVSDTDMAANRADVSAAPAVSDTDAVTAQQEPVDDAGQEFVNTQPYMENIVPVIVNTETADVPEEIDTEAFESQMITAMSQLFDMSEEDITDILEQGGIDVSALLFQVQPDDSVSLVNTETIQQLVMDVHGIEEKSAFLTNDLLSGELAQLTDTVKELGAQLFGVEQEELPQVEESLALSFAEQFMAVTETADVVPQEQMSVMTEMADVESSEWNVGNAEIQSDAAFAEPAETTDASAMQVVVEQADAQGQTGNDMQNSSGGTGSQENETESQTSQTVSSETTAQERTSATDTDSNTMTAADLFTDRLSEAFNEIADESVSGADTVMRNIVEQVVRQVRIRVLPETTSMELSLNPDSLGKVNLHVSSTGGVATATMVVENQMAKEALESQMITLKESFEEQGLKVDAVEVTVSEFGLKRDRDDAPQEQQQQKNGRRFRENVGLDSLDDTGETTVETVEARRNIDSVVDYTA
jgi:flagellar hook-length control protein FliK